MKLSVNKDQIIEGLQKASGILPPKAGAAYLRSIWLKAANGQLSIMATDANIEFTGAYPASVEEEGLVGVQGRAFVDLVRQLPSGDMHLSLDATGASILVRQGRKNYKLPVSSAEWFQNFSSFPEENTIIWSGDILQEIIDRISFCIDDDDAREATACLCFKACANGNIDACGLNGHQFALYSFKNDELYDLLKDNLLLIQKKYLQDIKKWLSSDEIELNISDKRLYIKGQKGAEQLSVPRVLHEYPDYNVFMSKLSEDNVSLLKLSRKDSIDALSRIQIFNTDSERCVFMDLTEKELKLSAQGADVGSASEELEVDYSGTISRIAFPTRNLTEIFLHFSSERLDMQLTGTEGPCGIRGDQDTNYTVIIMPMKISEKTYYTEEDE